MIRDGEIGQRLAPRFLVVIRMPEEFSRKQRVARQIQRELAIIIQREISDAHLGMVTVSAVKLSRDLAHAKVFVTFFCAGKQTTESSLKSLKQHGPKIRMALSRKVRLRLTPKIQFMYDTSVFEGRRMSNIVSSTIEEDNKKRNRFTTSEDERP